MELPEAEGNHKRRRKYKGTRLVSSGRWGAVIRDQQKFVWLGTHDTEEAAAMAYDAAALKLGLPRGYLNFPERAKSPSTEGNKTTGRKYRGVYLSSSGKWYARCQDPNPNTRSGILGYFSTAEDAAKAYDKAALKFQGYRAVLNFPDHKPHLVDLVSKSSPGSMPTLLSHEDGQNHESSLPSSSTTPGSALSPKILKAYAGKSPCSAPGTPSDADKSSQQLPLFPSKLGLAQLAGNVASSDIRPWKTASLTSEDVIRDCSHVLPRFPDPSPTYDHTLVSTYELLGLQLELKSSEECLFAAKAEVSELHQKCQSSEKAALLAKNERDYALFESSILLKDKERISAELKASQLRVAQLEEDGCWMFSVLKEAIAISNEARKEKDPAKKNAKLGLISNYFDYNSVVLRERFGYLDQLHQTATMSVDDFDSRVPGCSSTKDKVSTCLKLCL